MGVLLNVPSPEMERPAPFSSNPLCGCLIRQPHLVSFFTLLEEKEVTPFSTSTTIIGLVGKGILSPVFPPETPLENGRRIEVPCP